MHWVESPTTWILNCRGHALEMALRQYNVGLGLVQIVIGELNIAVRRM